MNVKKIAILSLLIAAGILLSLLESFIPVLLIIPGYKIGFSNLAGLYALYAYGDKDLVIVNVLRIVLASLATGSFFSLPFFISIAGCTLAMIAMILCKKMPFFSIFGVSMAGAAAHTFGQVLFVCWFYQQYVFEFFMPFLIALAIVSGLGIAWFTDLLLKRTASFYQGPKQVKGVSHA